MAFAVAAVMNFHANNERPQLQFLGGYRASNVLLTQLNGGPKRVVFVSILSRKDLFCTTVQLRQYSL